MATQRVTEIRAPVQGIFRALRFDRITASRSLCSLIALALLLQPEKGSEQTKCMTLSGQTSALSVGTLPQCARAGDRRPLPVDRAPGLKEKTLILLDVSTKNPVRTVNENFLSLQLDPSIIHDGWLDFLR
ncbi:Inactive heparanase-2 [Saguinus oedipus]|uniref:Inactive heparanase-2 n=1 Tax=Saguinus oedipus TaxID=9490 RepID=A0ABQ9UNY9_SAGOE|nr:Inactive heparanase-2 [Saguinus oedipus]